ncbi:hypothetical protein VB773_00690 [Haloarculaceae archaeon H-GB2-1]|nr:hypothetical protein [Haloarculaceae archaeon H-GB1-1]MEA5388219.1 hypothetical protein [Haloarculaceae archaeon H-GB11]MEA5406241.1 hypothetical protein [Haloarculaceae archaeon H-GB2-1]
MLDSDYSESAASPVDRLLPESLSRYDLTLAVIPVAFVASLFVGQLLAIPVRNAVMAASVVGALALLDGLFLHPPRSGSER